MRFAGADGEVADAATLCPSFYRAEVVQNPGAVDRLLDRLRRRVIGWMSPGPSTGASAA